LYRVVVAGPVATWSVSHVSLSLSLGNTTAVWNMEYENETNKVLFAERLRLSPINKPNTYVSVF